MFPDAQIINMVRDGRDVALSLLKRKSDLHVYNIYNAAKLWRTYLEAGALAARTLPGWSYIDIRYEDLVSRPRDMLIKICSFLNEEYDERLVHFKPYSGRQDAQRDTSLLSQPSIQSSNVNKWKGALGAYEEYFFERIAADLLRKYGYETVHAAGRVHPAEKIWYDLHQKICFLLSGAVKGLKR
jgi:hypothetical protein